MEPVQRTEPTLYISYSRKDEELVLRLETNLSERGIRVIFDRNLVEDGGDWQTALTNGLMNADCVLVLISSNSTSSRYVMNELGMARAAVLNSKGQKLLLPVVYGGVEIPAFIKDIQAIIWRDDEKEVVDRIAQAVFIFLKRRDSKQASPEITQEPGTESFEGNKKEAVPFRKTKAGIQESKKAKGQSGSGSSDRKNYWLLKMNPQTWEIERFRVGDSTFFNTYYFGEKRPEYHLFESVKKGDQVLGFASGNYQSIVCEMEVVKPVGPNHAQGESFTMVVTRIIASPVPLSRIGGTIARILPRLKQDKRPPELFFELSESDHAAMLSSSISSEEAFSHNYQPFFLTEGNHAGTDDQLDFENDYNSFASVIALERVHPPLAIGLFGNWGSGKSFFMEKLSEQIERNAKSKDPDYVEHIVHVKFNSWHYSDTNLWASLTTQIFESLNDYAQKKAFGPEAIEAIYKGLNITGQQLEETKGKLAANDARANSLKQQKADKEDTIRKKKETLDLWQAKDFFRLVFSDPYIQDDFKDIKEQFQSEKLIDNIGEIAKRYAEVDTAVGRVMKSFDLLKEDRKGRWKCVWILAGLFAVVGWLILGPLKGVIQDVISGAAAATGLAVVWLANLVAQLRPYISRVNQFYRRLKSLKETVEKEKERVRLKEHNEVARLQKDLDMLTQEREILAAEEKLTEERRERLLIDLKEIGCGKLLASFLAGRSADDAYIKQLGIVSWIRRDFSKLNDLFQKQKRVQETEKENRPEVQIDRIVLYIDDLDRCNEDVVVKVLEAIHLLLAFPLFVVVVGVDPRWLNNALSERYKNLFANPSAKNMEKKGSRTQTNQPNALHTETATSYDYLEKIFQIPFALKPINGVGREKLIGYLLKKEMKSEAASTDISADLKPQAQEATRPQDIISASPAPESESKPMLESREAKTQVAAKNKERLVFSDAELIYMQKISPLFGQTPRMINRYINIYRIIKAHGSLKVVGSYSEDEFMPIMFILAVVVGYSELAEAFIAEIAKTNDSLQFNKFLKRKEVNRNLVAVIKPLTSDIAGMPMECFTRNLELISRFSFRTLMN
jgi:hypothetical protein